MKPILVFCEGAHDIAFLMRTLVATGDFEEDKTPIAKYPPFYKDFLINRFKQRDFEPQSGKKRSKAPNAENYNKLAPPVLWAALRPKQEQSQCPLWFFCAFGQDQHAAVCRFIQQIREGIDDWRERGESTGVDADTFAFLYDADEIGEEAKLKQWQQNYAAQFPDIATPRECGWQSWGNSGNTNIGVFILRATNFGPNGIKIGDLEDITLPLMQCHNEPLYKDASDLVDNHWPMEASSKYKRKATITIAGQMAHPSYSMAVILKESDHLFDEHLVADPSCQRIVRFFKDGCGMT
jgi:hypothetical protein